jgi:hypothetical protein
LKRTAFLTEESFLNFKTHVKFLIHIGCLADLSESVTKGPFKENTYACLECKQQWNLTEPDQAFRGWCHERNK